MTREEFERQWKGRRARTVRGPERSGRAVAYDAGSDSVLLAMDDQRHGGGWMFDLGQMCMAKKWPSEVDPHPLLGLRVWWASTSPSETVFIGVDQAAPREDKIQPSADPFPPPLPPVRGQGLRRVCDDTTHERQGGVFMIPVTFRLMRLGSFCAVRGGYFGGHVSPEDRVYPMPAVPRVGEEVWLPRELTKRVVSVFWDIERGRVVVTVE